MLIAIDPSIANLGYCVGKKNEEEVIDFGHKRTYPKYKLASRVRALIDFLKEKVEKYNVDTLVIEYPGKGKYHSTGVQTFIKLGVSIGIVLGLKDWQEVYQYTPREWKDNMPKKETEWLVKSKGFDVEDDNAIDALGLYYHAMRTYD